MDSKVDHVFHVWINSEADRFREKKADAIDPHERGLYNFRSALQMLDWLGKQITKERLGKLTMLHQQCSHCNPEPLKENYLQCWLGKKLVECPILLRLRETFAVEKKRQYYADITDEQIDEVAAMVCVWHMLMGTDAFVDWNEGAIQDVSDRMFWRNVYDNLMGGEQNEKSDY